MDYEQEELLPKTAIHDTAWNILLIFLIILTLKMAVSAFLKETKEVKEGAANSVRMEGEYAVTVRWDDKSDDDIDTYVMDPDGHLVCYRRKEDGLMHLDRDDLGKENDLTRGPDGQATQLYKNEEHVIIRGIVPGEYIVNVHMFDKYEPEPRAVTVELSKIKDGTIIIQKEVILEQYGSERTAFRFTLNAEGVITELNELQRKLTTESVRSDTPSIDDDIMNFRRFRHGR